VSLGNTGLSDGGIGIKKGINGRSNFRSDFTGVFWLGRKDSKVNPVLLKKPLKSLVSSVPNDLARFLSELQEAILSILILQSVLNGSRKRYVAPASET
jgi:hypothetical protein